MPDRSNIADCLKPRDKRTRLEWCEEYVKPPNSARNPSGFDSSVTPWLREPIEFSERPTTRKMVCMMPTGAGKTTIVDCVIPHAISEEPGGILLALQSNEDCQQYVEERLMPTLRGVPSVANLMAAMHRHAIRKDAVIFPHMPMYMGGANSTNFQRKSVRYCLGDEVWNKDRWRHGLVSEMEARTHDRWNQLVVLLGQGGWTHFLADAGLIMTEWEARWQTTDQRIWHWRCPECGEVQRWRSRALHYETVEKEDGSLDETGIFQSARYICMGRCASRFEDTIAVKRALAMDSRYVVTNPKHRPGNHGWNCSAFTLHYLPWGQLAVELAQAHRARKLGDEEPIRIFRQKRMAENYREEEASPPSALQSGDYSLLDYAAGETWEGECARFMHVDVQRNHFWATARAWKPDGSSRLIWEGKISTWEGLRELQKQLKIGFQGETEKPFQVGVDCNYNIDDEVMEHCAEYQWVALEGDKGETYPWKSATGVEYRYYSKLRSVRTSSGKVAKVVTWSNRSIKRMLERFRDGKRESFEVPRDVSEDYKISMFSEVEKDVMGKKTRKIERRFVQIGSRPNHKWDCECMGIVMALAYYILRERPSQTTNPEPADGDDKPLSTDS